MASGQSPTIWTLCRERLAVADDALGCRGTPERGCEKKRILTRSYSLNAFCRQMQQGTPSHHPGLPGSHEFLFPVPKKVLCGVNPLLSGMMVPQTIVAGIQQFRSCDVSPAPDSHSNLTLPAAAHLPTLLPCVAIQKYPIAWKLLFDPPMSPRHLVFFPVAEPKTALASLIFAAVH